MRRPRRPVHIEMARQQDEARRMCRGKRADPVGIGGNVWSGETGLRNLRTDGLVERAPLRQKSSGIVVLRAHCSPTAEAVRLIADLERQQIGAERARYIGRLGG